MTDQIDLREYGRLEQQVEQLSADVHSLKLTVEAMNNLMQQSKGGWKTLVMLGGIAGTAGAAITWIAGHWK